jgi:hypothetical protein
MHVFFGRRSYEHEAAGILQSNCVSATDRVPESARKQVRGEMTTVDFHFSSLEIVIAATLGQK